MKITAIIIIVLGVFYSLSSCSVLGRRPTSNEKKKFSQSENFDLESSTFKNKTAGLINQMDEKMSFFEILKEWINNPNESIPKEKLPEIKSEITDFMKPSQDIKVIWLGHSTLLLNIAGKTVLLDPVFSSHASPVSFMIKRFQRPVISLSELPPIDYIIISHDHYDHLDMKSIKFFKNSPLTKFIVPLGVGGHLQKWGIQEDKIVERDWWQEITYDNITFTATPSQHFSGRGFKRNETLWASWVIKTPQHNIYFSGDSGYASHFKEIGEKLGPFDIAFIENGQYNKRWRPVHLHPEEGAQAFHDLNAKHFFPIHWGMFELSLHSWDEPIRRISKLSKEQSFSLLSPKLGEIVTINDEQLNQQWWD